MEGVGIDEAGSDGGWIAGSGKRFGVFACRRFVVLAIGRRRTRISCRREWRWAEGELERGRIVIDRATGQTTNPKYFAGGDCVNGGREVVDAVADGKRAGIGIAAWLEARQRPKLRQSETTFCGISDCRIRSGWRPRRRPTAANRSCAPSTRAGAGRCGRRSASRSRMSVRATRRWTGTASA